MSFISFFAWFNHLMAMPTTLLFLGVAIILTIKTRFLQLRALGRLAHILKHGVQRRAEVVNAQGEQETIGTFQALFTALATTIGMGNVVGPSIAIVSGGPGALFWLQVYIFFGSVTKFVEVVFAFNTRTKVDDGRVVGGPMEYLKSIRPWLAQWFAFVMLFVMMGFSSGQSNTLALIFEQKSVAPWVVGIVLALMVYAVLRGGISRIGAVATKLVPLMFILYVGFGLIILVQQPYALIAAIKLVFYSVFHPKAAFGGFLGATLFQAMHGGIYKGIFITEAGLGTSSIAHATADSKYATDQGILAMYSMISDAFLTTMSGLLVLMTGVWNVGAFRSTMVYEVFKMNAPVFGQVILLIAITLFVVTTVIGNTFNGLQSAASLFPRKWVTAYMYCSLAMIVAGAILPTKTTWDFIDFIMTFAILPNLIGLLWLTYKRPELLEIE